MQNNIYDVFKTIFSISFSFTLLIKTPINMTHNHQIQITISTLNSRIWEHNFRYLDHISIEFINKINDVKCSRINRAFYNA